MTWDWLGFVAQTLAVFLCGAKLGCLYLKGLEMTIMDAKVGGEAWLLVHLQGFTPSISVCSAPLVSNIQDAMEGTNEKARWVQAWRAEFYPQSLCKAGLPFRTSALNTC